MDEPRISEAIATLGERKDAWASSPVTQKIRHLDSMIERTDRTAEAWVEAAVKAKRIPSDSPLTGEEWLSGPWALLRALNQLKRTLSAIAKGESPVHGRPTHTRPDGQVVVDVFPGSIFDRLLLSGFSAQVWMQPGVTADSMDEHIATFYKISPRKGHVALVLGAGNIASIAPLDVLYKMFAEGLVCLLKMNPVNDYLGPFLEEIFASLIDDGFMRFVYGGAEVGAFLVAHGGIEEVHVTGDYRTYNAIVYGRGDEGEKRRTRDDPAITKRVTAELGNVTPTIVVPGPWSSSDLSYQAQHVLTQKGHNAGFNCIAAQLLVLPDEWNLKDLFVDAIRSTMRSCSTRESYYPGGEERQNAAIARNSDAEVFESTKQSGARRALITGLDSSNPGEYCFNNEFFSDVLAVTSLPGRRAAEFLKVAVRFCNESVWGTLGVNIIVHPRTMEELGPALEQAIADLRYGSIGVNAWVGVGFLLSETTWGAYPAHPRNDIRSGTGVVHNSMFFDKPQKSVVRQPFYPFPRNLLHGEWHLSPKPPWFVTNRQASSIARRITRFEARPGIAKLPGIFWAAMRG